MPKYRFEASNPQGEIVEGDMEVDHEQKLIDILYLDGLVPVNIELIAEKPQKKSAKKSAKHNARSGEPSAKKSLFAKSSKLNQRDIIEFTRFVANLLKSGFSIDKALRTLFEISESNPRIKVLARQVLTVLEEGKPLSFAMQKVSSKFSNIYLSLIKAGEESGRLPLVFERLAEYLQEQREFQGKIKATLTYPVIILAVSAISVAVLFGFVIPRFVGIFEDSGQRLPMLTQVMVTVSELFRRFFLMGILTVVSQIFLFRFMLKRPNFRLRFDRGKLRWPALGSTIHRVYMTRMTANLGMLLFGGVPLVDAMVYARNTVGNTYIEQEIDEVISKVKKGRRISESMQGVEAFPALIAHMIGVGEESGKLPENLQHVSESLNTEVRNSIQGFVAMLGPVMILVMGGFIALIIASMLLPVLSMTNLQF